MCNMKTQIKKLNEISSYCTEKILKEEISVEDYIATTNMIAGMNGVETAVALPPSNKLNKYEPGDILIANIRPYFKKIWKADKVGGCDADILNIRANNSEVLPEYLYLALFRQEFFDYIMVGAKGVKMPRGDKEFIMNYNVPVPSREKQKEIINRIKPIFDLIESNKKTIEYLEELSQLLYHKWFVEFNFPNDDGRPYRESGGKMVEFQESHTPEGWTFSTVGKECEVIMGQSPPSSTYNESEDGLPFYQGVVDYGFKYPSVSKWCNRPTRIADPGDILLSVRAPVGRINVSLERCCIGRGVSAIRLDGTLNFYALYALDKGMKRLIKSGNGTVFNSIKKDDILNLVFPNPPFKIIEKFEESIRPYQEKILRMTIENDKLKETRDLLIKKMIR